MQITGSSPSLTEWLSPSTDGRLLEETFSKTLEEATPRLRRHLRGKLGSAEAADDALQETFLRMMRYRDIKDAGEIRALLYRVAGSVVADSHRRARSQHASDHRPLDGLELASTAPTPDRVLTGCEEFATVKQAIGMLPPRCRQVFLLHRFENLSYRDIARRLGTSPRTVENQVAHALTVCRRAIREYHGRTF